MNSTVVLLNGAMFWCYSPKRNRSTTVNINKMSQCLLKWSSFSDNTSS